MDKVLRFRTYGNVLTKRTIHLRLPAEPIKFQLKNLKFNTLIEYSSNWDSKANILSLQFDDLIEGVDVEVFF